jgi:pimeloyl-ACP methyl ester carboxylesterase
LTATGLGGLAQVALLLLLAVALAGAALVLVTAVIGFAVQRGLPPLGAFIEVAGERIHWLEQGQGPPLLLIHGLCGQMGNFTHSLVERLAGDHRVIVFDRPGSGHSSRAKNADGSLVQQAALVAELIRLLGLDRPTVVGHSLGGAIGLMLALNHPASVCALALVAPVTQPQSTPPPAFELLAIRSAGLRALVAWTIATPWGILQSARVLKTIFAPQTGPLDIATRGGGLLTLRPANFIHASQDMAAAEIELPALARRYGELACPVSILFGTGDLILDPQRNGVQTAACNPARIRLTLTAGGHMLPVSVPDEVAAFIRQAGVRV